MLKIVFILLISGLLINTKHGLIIYLLNVNDNKLFQNVLKRVPKFCLKLCMQELYPLMTNYMYVQKSLN